MESILAKVDELKVELLSEVKSKAKPKKKISNRHKAILRSVKGLKQITCGANIINPCTQDKCL